MDKLLKITLNEKIRTQRYPSRSYYSLLAEAEGFAPQILFAITPVSQTIVPSIVWSARCGEIIIISFTRRLPSRSNPSINKKEKHKQQVFVFLSFGGNELRDVELYAFNEEAKYLLGLPLC